MSKFFTKEVKIAITVIVCVTLLVYGINFLKGVNLLTPTNYYYISCKNVSGLTMSAPVNIEGYKIGLVITHNGKVYIYKSGEKPFLPELFDKRVDKYCQKEYNMSVEEAHKKVLAEFEKEYGTSWKEI